MYPGNQARLDACKFAEDKKTGNHRLERSPPRKHSNSVAIIS